MKIEDFQTRGLPIERLVDYYRDDYDMILDILSGKWTEVVVIGLRRFGKTSLLKRIEGFVNQPPDYREFISKGLTDWQRDRDGNPPRREFFDEIESLNGRALYLSMSDSLGVLQRRTIKFLSEITGDPTFEDVSFEKIEHQLPPLIYVLIDEFLILSQKSEDAEQKREFFLKIHRSAQNLKKDVVFIIAEPPSVFSVFDESIRKDSTIAEVTDALQNRNIFFLNGLSLHEKLNLFCLKKSENYGEHAEPTKIRSVLDQLSGIPLEIQIAGKSFFSCPEKSISEILKDVAKAFGGNLKNSIIPTMNLRQKAFIRLIAESEKNENSLSWDNVKKTGHKLFYDLRDFGLVKIDSDEFVKFTSEPIRSILCEELENFSAILDDETYRKELKTMIISEEEKQIFASPEFKPWDGRIRIHHFSDLSLGSLTAGFSYCENSHLDLFSLNNKENPFEAYLKLLKSHSKYRPHIVVFTGDIAISHHRYCYRGLKEFIAEILVCMNPLPGERSVIPGKQVILVPGEMDISDTAEAVCENPGGLDSLDYCKFGGFFNTFEVYGIPPQNASQNGLDKIISIVLPSTHGAPGYNLEILPFNSATMVWPSQTNRRRLEVLQGLTSSLEKDEDSLTRERFNLLLDEEIGFLNMNNIETDPDKIENVDDTLRIAVTHHNLNPHKARGESNTVDTLNSHEVKTILLRNQFSIVLHGHQRTPLFIKETLYQKDKTGLKTMSMNGAGKFTETKFNVDDNTFGPSFNSYVLRRMDNRDEETGRNGGDFRVHSTVFTFKKDENKFTRDQPVVKEEIFIDED